MNINRRAMLFMLAAVMVAASINFNLAAKPAALLPVAPVMPQPDISVSGSFASKKAQRGRNLQATVVLDIPKGYHVNANRTLSKYLVPTTLKIEVGDKVKVGSISYPKAITRTFSFSEEKLAVYEGRAAMRFNLTIPADFPHSKMLVKASVKYQSCSDSECYPPVTRAIEMWIDME
ncbi:MAG: hypothetical protein H7Y30_13855 [Pyrinomonadaceae bacterium]|nr:hypothetical protein [Pyrinomonadaceae bacterium]